jgi:hypothetical protein
MKTIVAVLVMVMVVVVVVVVLVMVMVVVVLVMVVVVVVVVLVMVVVVVVVIVVVAVVVVVAAAVVVILVVSSDSINSSKFRFDNAVTKPCIPECQLTNVESRSSSSGNLKFVHSKIWMCRQTVLQLYRMYATRLNVMTPLCFTFCQPA